MKKVFVLLLVMVTILTSVSFSGHSFFIGSVQDAKAAEVVDSGSCGKNVTWVLDSDGTLTLSGSGKMTNYTYTANSLGLPTPPWWVDSENDGGRIKKIVINDGVTSIGNCAFVCCSELTSILIPSSVTAINSYAFHLCVKLEDVYYTGNVSEWNQISVGDNNDSLENVTIHFNDTPISDRLPSGISSLFPENGCLDYDYRNDSYLRITFEKIITRYSTSSSYDMSAKLNFAKGSIRIYSARNNSLIWEAHENPYKTGTCSEITVNAKNPKSLIIKPSNLTSLLDPITSYYVVMDEGFVDLGEGNESPQIVTRRWAFTTSEADTGRIENISTRNNYVYSDHYFSKSSEVYHHDLAKFALNVTTAAGVSDSDYSEMPYYAKNFFAGIGFGNDEDEAFEAYDYDIKETNSIACCITSKNISSLDETIIILCVRGAGYVWEWGGNFNVGTSTDHEGFGLARNGVLNDLESFISQNAASFKSKIKLLITGYSRAGATANLVGGALDTLLASPTNMGLCQEFWNVLKLNHNMKKQIYLCIRLKHR